MSSDHPIEDPSAPADPPLGDPDLPALIRERGEPLLEGLEKHAPGSRMRADATGAYALATAVGLGFGRSGGRALPRDRPACRCREDLRAGRRPPGGGRATRARGRRPRGRVRVDPRRRRALRRNGPAGLSGSEIPVFSRIIRAAKRCDEFVREGAKPAELRALAGTELDPAMVDALASMLEQADASE